MVKYKIERYHDEMHGTINAEYLQKNAKYRQKEFKV